MGNGPGGIADYQRIFEAYDRLQGGFIWEWIDHGIKDEPELGYAYGGDFGEELHDGNFVCDGLIFPDRTPSPGLVEYKKVIEPVRIEGDGTDGTVRVTNAYDFADLSALAFEWSYDVDGDAVETRHRWPCPPLAPGRVGGREAAGRPPPTRGGDGVAVDGPGAARRGHRLGASRAMRWRGRQLPVAPRAPIAGGRRVPRPRPTAAGSPSARPPSTPAPVRCGRSAGSTSPGLRLDVWRAPTDNDDGAAWQPDIRYGVAVARAGPAPDATPRWTPSSRTRTR